MLLTTQLPALPEYIQHRIDLFDQIKSKYDAEIAGMWLNETPRAR